MDLSVVVPAYNEEGNLKPLYGRLKDVLDGLDRGYEIIFVNDGSSDGTREILNELSENESVKAVHFRRNFGQTPAMQAGFDHAQGEIIVPMDADLQNDPEDVPKLIERLEEGSWDVVSGWRKDREDPFSKRIFSRFSNWLARRLTGVDLHDFGCTLKAYRRESLEDVNLYGEMHRFIPALVAMNGYSVAEMKVKHHERRSGETKYSFRRLLKGFLDLFYIKFWSSYSTRPLHLFGLFGVVLLLAGLVTGAHEVLYEFLYLGRELNVGPLLMLSVLFLILSMQFIIFGFLGEIQIRTYFESTKKSNYKVDEVVG